MICWGGVPCLATFAANDGGLADERSGFQRLGRAAGRALDDDVFGRLAARNLALCVADSEKLSTPAVMTADYGYFRLRDEGYTPVDIARWAEVIREKASGCGDAFVYFKHEESGKGPEFAHALMRSLNLDS